MRRPVARFGSPRTGATASSARSAGVDLQKLDLEDQRDAGRDRRPGSAAVAEGQIGGEDEAAGATHTHQPAPFRPAVDDAARRKGRRLAPRDRAVGHGPVDERPDVVHGHLGVGVGHGSLGGFRHFVLQSRCGAPDAVAAGVVHQVALVRVERSGALVERAGSAPARAAGRIGAGSSSAPPPQAATVANSRQGRMRAIVRSLLGSLPSPRPGERILAPMARPGQHGDPGDVALLD